MNRWKGLTGLILSIVMLTSLFMVFPSEAEAEDMSDGFLAEQVLTRFGIYDGQNLSMDMPITRGEMAYLAARLVTDCNFEGYGSMNDLPADVNGDYFAAEAISAAAALGIMQGDENGLFQPEYPLSAAQLAAVCVNICGYRRRAAELGGYPMGYLRTANQLGIMDTINCEAPDVSVTGKQVLFTLFHLLDTEVYEIRSVSQDMVYLQNSGETVASYYLNAECVEGIVYANEITSLYDHNAGLRENEILINNSVYRGNDNVWSYLGKSVVLYTDKDTSRIRVIYEDEQKNKSVSFYADDIDAGTSTETLNASDGSGKSKTYHIDPLAAVIVNGKALDEEVTPDILRPDDGMVTLTDNDADGIYEVVFVEILHTMIVSAVDEKGVYSDTLTESSVLTEDGDTCTVYIDGKIGGMGSIPAGSALLAGQSRNKSGNKHYILRASSKTIGGKTEILSEDYVVIGGERFKRSPYAKELSAGIDGIFLIDAFGRIAGVSDGTLVRKPYAYVIGAKLKSGLSKGVEIRLLRIDGTVGVFNIADRVRIDGSMVKNAEEILNILKTAASSVGADDYRQVIMCETDDESGTIKSIDTVLSNNDSEESIKAADEIVRATSLRWYKSYNLFTTLVSAASGSKNFVYDGGTVFFYAPADEEEDNYKVLTSGEFPDSLLLTNNQIMTAYDMDEIKRVGAVSFDNKLTDAISYESYVYMVADSYTKLDENGASCRCLMLYSSKNTAGEEFFVDASVSSEAEKGDLIVCVFDRKRKITEIVRIFCPKDADGSNGEAVMGLNTIRNYTLSASSTETGRVLLGELYAYDGSQNRISHIRNVLSNPRLVAMSDLEPNMIKNSKIFVCEFKDDGKILDIRTGDAGDLRTVMNYGEDASIVAAACRSVGYPRDLFVYNNLKR